jgi:hypothetical protein
MWKIKHLTIFPWGFPRGFSTSNRKTPQLQLRPFFVQGAAACDRGEGPGKRMGSMELPTIIQFCFLNMSSTIRSIEYLIDEP